MVLILKVFLIKGVTIVYNIIFVFGDLSLSCFSYTVQ